MSRGLVLPSNFSPGTKDVVPDYWSHEDRESMARHSPTEIEWVPEMIGFDFCATI
jgi:hypothetical protein